MDATKDILQSKAVWGAIAALLAQLISVGLHLDPKQSAEVLSLSGQTVTVGLQVVSLLGAAMALYGRLSATTLLTVGKSATVIAPSPSTKEPS